MAVHLILFAHGSSRASWRAPIEALAARVGEASGLPVVAAWLEAAQPDLMAAVGDAVAAGAQRIALLPLFWSSGGHVERDLPVQVDAARARWPEVAIDVLPTLGEHPLVVAAITAIAAAAAED